MYWCVIKEGFLLNFFLNSFELRNCFVEVANVGLLLVKYDLLRFLTLILTS